MLRAYRGDTLIYIGDAEGATGSVRFHRELALNWTLEDEVRLPNWPKLRDGLMVYRRNAVGGRSPSATAASNATASSRPGRSAAAIRAS